MNRLLNIGVFYSVMMGLFVGCTSKEIDNDYTTIHVPPDYGDAIALSSITDAVNYVVLEATDKSLISTVRKILLDRGGNYYLLDGDQQRLLRFSPDGVYLNDIGIRGRGPGEYTELTDADLDNDTIKIYDAQTGNVLTYDLNGAFSAYEPYEPGYSQFFAQGDTLGFYGPCGGFCEDLSLYVGDQKMNYFTSVYKDYMRENLKSFYKSGRGVYYTDLFDNKGYRIVDGKPIVDFEVDFDSFVGNSTAPVTPDDRILKRPNNLAIWMMSDSRLVFTFFYQQELVYQFYDIQKQESLMGTVLQNDINYLPIDMPLAAVDQRLYAYRHVRPSAESRSFFEKLPAEEQARISDVIDLYTGDDIDGKQVVVWFDLADAE